MRFAHSAVASEKRVLWVKITCRERVGHEIESEGHRAQHTEGNAGVVWTTCKVLDAPFSKGTLLRRTPAPVVESRL
jgi:hypothetical protein